MLSILKSFDFLAATHSCLSDYFVCEYNFFGSHITSKFSVAQTTCMHDDGYDDGYAKFDLNFNPNNLFEILSIKDCLDDFLICLRISFMALKMLKLLSSELILINSEQSRSSMAFYLLISSSIYLSL